jgi:hypothetical protein
VFVTEPIGFYVDKFDWIRIAHRTQEEQKRAFFSRDQYLVVHVLLIKRGKQRGNDEKGVRCNL